MNLSDEVDLEDYVGRPDKISNADISAICQEVAALAKIQDPASSKPCLSARSAATPMSVPSA